MQTEKQIQNPPGFAGSQRYPYPAIEVLDPAFLRYRIFSASIEAARGSS